MAPKTTNNDDPSPELLQPLILLFNQGKLAAVHPQITELLRHFPRSAALHNFSGIVSAARGQADNAIASYRRAVELQPEFIEAHNNLAATQLQAGDLPGAIKSFANLTDLTPNSADAHYNHAVALQAAGEFESAVAGFRKTLALNPDIPEAHNNLGLALFKIGKPEAALSAYRAAIERRPDFAEAYNNLGVVLHNTGALNAALEQFSKALEINPQLVDAHNHRGNVCTDRGDLPAARRSFASALDLNPKHADACWNMAGTADDIQHCLHWLDRCLGIDPDHVNAALLRAALLAALGDHDELRLLQESPHRDHPFMRSFSWVFSQPQLPLLPGNRWAFFDAVVQHCDTSRPFYEFGVWRGQSFRYLMQTFPRGFGFDTFAGLPEDWHEKSRGSYSSQGQIPEVDGGEFIAGTFEQSLPVFFSRERPLAGLINFDADLYTSTLCALENTDAVIDEKTVLVFDELLMNEHWEQDEYRALVEYCQNKQCDYEVLAVCFFSKQVAVKLVR